MVMALECPSEHRPDCQRDGPAAPSLPAATAADFAYEDLPPGASTSANLMAGAMAGIAEHTITYPIDSIKTRMQMVASHPSATYTGMFNALVRIGSGEGLHRLWRGIVSVMVGAGPAHAVYFAAYEQAKLWLVPRSSPHQSSADRGHYPLRTGLAGAVATTASDAVMTPFDVVKQRMQAHGSHYRSVLDCAWTMARTEGAIAFYISYPTTLLLNIPFHCIQFPTYEAMQGMLNPTGAYHVVSHVVSGGVAGALAAAITTPLDVVKTTLQTRGLLTADQQLRVRGMAEALRFVMVQRGWPGLARGLLPRVLTHMPATAVCWTTYEYVKWLILS